MEHAARMLTKIKISLYQQHQQQTNHQKAEADMAYKAMSKWKKNIFTLPKGKSGKDFISEMTNLIEEWNSNSPRKS